MSETRRDSPPIAWVESPLQLIGAAEWASAHDTKVPVAGRLTTQMSETADELVARGAPFSDTEPYLGIPWNLLARHRHWLVGDGFSGQFRLAVAVLRPRRITFLDDGANTLALADALTGRGALCRPGVAERGVVTRLRPFVLEQVLGRAYAGGVDFFTAFEFGSRRAVEIDALGIRVRRHRFAWTRQSARPFTDDTDGRIVLGSARPADGRMPLPQYLDWVSAQAARASVTYLPHRRETDAQRNAVSAIAGVKVVDRRIPAELLLAGTTRPLEIMTLASSASTTLPSVLRGSGSVIVPAASADQVHA
ncbi:hypothetical protein [Microbacterium lacus]|uniref:Uncharacterized protein n=1 Tax=Microbacterium lacus TaxID=415217 RepID=A0ABN2GDP0_9MICO